MAQHFIRQMTEWWTALPLELKLFYGIGILALIVVIIQLLMTLLGFDADSPDAGFNADVGDFDHGTGIGLFSSQTIAAFFTAFGWVGVAAIKNGLSPFAAGCIAFGFGVASMFAMFFMLRSLLSLQSKGNLDYKTVVGDEATVYVTIPGSDADEGGQIQVNIQGRLTTASARKASPGALKPGSRVRIVAVNGPASFIVEAL